MKPLTTYKAIEKVIGTKPQNTVGLTFITFLLTILTLPLRLLTLFNKGYSDISDSDWELMLSDDNIKIEKKQIAATGFDDCIKFYGLTSTDKKLNDLLRENIFGDFIVKINNGIFLRQFKSPSDWPNSKLVYISLDTYKVENISKSKSSWVDWQYNFVDDKQFDIVTENAKEYSKILQIRTV
ncbi:MAG: hypothetical protein COW63_07560 [Bacteroidetes bacterium CG18_big_fil_WC_8_21_14_2_50_41_14]|nr:MAG: hypothetical protein COW63_07560 [Bacteroidetes bacterium CG18_big_fil_WC_8_21_14_2_50_41_14]